MTPEQLARNLASSDRAQDRALGVAMIYRGLTDHDPADPFRQPWPADEDTARRAATFLGITEPDDDLIATAIGLAPTISDAMLNRRP